MTVPFSSDRKRMTTAVKLDNGKIRLFIKGTPAKLMPFCEYVEFCQADKEGEKRLLTED